MNCVNCGSELQNGSLFCENCGASVRNTDTSKKSKKAIIAIVSAVVAAAIVLGAAVFFFSPEKSASARLAKVSVDSFSTSCKIIGNDITVGTDIDTDIEIVIPSALTEGNCFVKVGDISYYRKNDYEYCAYSTGAGLFRRVSPDADDETQEIGIGKYLDYISAFSEGDYGKLAELINSGSFTDDVVFAAKFINRVDEVVDDYFSDEYMTANYGFAYTVTEERESFVFSLSVNKLLDTAYEITEGSKSCFFDVDEYNETLSEIKALREKLGENGDKMAVNVAINVKDGLYESIKIGVSHVDKKDVVSVNLDFSDYGIASVDTKYDNEYDKRKEQLGEKDYLMWVGFFTVSDYYDKD